MKKINLIILFLSSIFIVNSCSSLSEAGKVLRNEKKSSTDEFLIKKRDPLTQPPDFDKMPEPGSIDVKTEESISIEEILKTRSSKNKQNQKQSSSEESILNQIKK
tara:strand:+ start:545 stop:859 length:315 start_codon:yes stop_codon:yes gene_type:complete